MSEREEDMRLTDAGLEDANAFFERNCQRIVFLGFRAIEAVNVGQSVVQDRGVSRRIVFQLGDDRLPCIQEPLHIPLERLAIHGDGCGAGFGPLIQVGQAIEQRLRDENIRLASGHRILPKRLQNALLKNGCIQPLLGLWICGASVIFKGPVA